MGMVIAISSGVTNIVLDALFVAIFKRGVAGAAAATVIGQSIGGIIPLIYFIMKKNHLLWFTKARWNSFTIRKTAANGFADFINNASVSLIGIVFNTVLMQRIGSDGVVAYGIVMYVNYIATGIFMGYSVGIAPIYGYNLGAENYDEIRNLFKKSMMILAAFAVALFIIIKIVAGGLASIFVGYDDGLIKLTTKAIRLYSWSFLLCWFNIHTAAMFVALNDGKVSGTLSFTRTLVFQLGSVLLRCYVITNNINTSEKEKSIMRKKTLSTLVVMLGLSLLAAGCGSSTAGSTEAPEISVADVSEAESTAPETTPESTETESQAESQTDISVTKEAEGGSMGEAVTSLSKVDMSKWQYNADDDVFYQIGISYCENPADANYETLAVFVPGAYLTGTENGDGTYTCAVSAETVNGYTAETAPIVMLINTPGYSAMAALTDYSSSVSTYTKEGFVYAHAGCRGRDAGAPSGATDLKAAVRYLRYCDDTLPGSAERIFTFGMSGGGAQSALMGSTGDSELYTPYLEQIGAVMGLSDAVCGSMCWCPITNLDTADESYEWMMGCTRSGLSEEEQQISDALAVAWAQYVNEAGIKDENGTVLTLEESADGIWQSGSYYDYIKGVIEHSLNNFLADTTFPYDASSSSGGFGGGRPGGGQRTDGAGGFPGGGMPDGDIPEGGQMPDMGEQQEGTVSIEDVDDITRNETSSGVSLSGTYETAQDYIDALNTNGEWVIYDASSNTAAVTSIEDFAKAVKIASKNLGAFDQLDGGQGENTLFGYGDGNGAHFDTILAGILSDLGSSYAADYASDLEKTDSAGYTAAQRVDMYTPLYYLLESSEGYGTSAVADYWRIRTGIFQGDTSVTTEANLALALQNYDSVQSVDFETVWGQKHVEAERTGSSTENFIAWVNECLK